VNRSRKFEVDLPIDTPYINFWEFTLMELEADMRMRRIIDSVTASPSPQYYWTRIKIMQEVMVSDYSSRHPIALSPFKFT
jgi:hypothetical protein